MTQTDKKYVNRKEFVSVLRGEIEWELWRLVRCLCVHECACVWVRVREWESERERERERESSANFYRQEKSRLRKREKLKDWLKEWIEKENGTRERKRERENWCACVCLRAYASGRWESAWMRERERVLKKITKTESLFLQRCQPWPIEVEICLFSNRQWILFRATKCLFFVWY